MQPNILLISLIPLRADHLSCYGYDRQTSPNIDRLAEEGVRFENAYTTSAWTPPAHASLMTGLYPSRHGVMGSHGLGNEVLTLPAVLQAHGYETVAFTSNPHVGSFKGLHQGFAEFSERPLQKTGQRPRPGRLTSFKNKIRHYLPLALTDTWRLLTKPNKYRFAESTTAQALNWLNKPRTTPFFMLCEYSDMHHPYFAPEPHRYRFASQHPSLRLRRLNANPYLHMTGLVPAGQADFHTLQALYDGEIYATDAYIGQLIDQLRQTNQLDNTIVVIMSPHGENIGEHGLGAHQGSLHETVVRVPLVMRYPAGLPTATTYTPLTQTTDLFPTLLALTNCKADLTTQGQNILPLTRPHRQTVVAEWAGPVPGQLQTLPAQYAQPFIQSHFQRTLQMVRQGDYKLIWGSDGWQALYNVKTDPAELDNLAEKQPGRVQALIRQFHKQRDTLTPHRGTPEPAQIEDDVLTLLRAGGYKV